MRNKLLGWGVAALAAYYLIAEPRTAAGAVRATGSGFADIAQSLGDFLGALG